LTPFLGLRKAYLWLCPVALLVCLLPPLNILMAGVSVVAVPLGIGLLVAHWKDKGNRWKIVLACCLYLLPALTLVGILLLN